MHASLNPSPLPRYLQASELASWLQVDPESGRVEAHQKVPPRSTFLGGWYTTQILAVDNGEGVSRAGAGESKRGALAFRKGTQPWSKILLTDFRRSSGGCLGLREGPQPGQDWGHLWAAIGEREAHPLVPGPALCGEVASDWGGPQDQLDPHLPLLSLSGTPPRTATGTLSVEVLEVNDHAPSLFPTTGSLCREGGALVLSATDQDLEPHAGPFHFRFGLSSAHNWTLSHPNGNRVSWGPTCDGGSSTQALGGAWAGFPGRAPPHRAHRFATVSGGGVVLCPAGACQALVCVYVCVFLAASALPDTKLREAKDRSSGTS